MFSGSSKKQGHLLFSPAGRRIRTFGGFFLFAFFLITCEKQTTPIEDKRPVLNVTLQDIAVTEAWLQIETGKTTPEDSLILLRNDSTVIRISPLRADTIIYDSTLLPAHSYKYQAVLKRKGFDLAKSEVVNTTTMDTTSHEFTWESYLFRSPYGTGVLRDVAIINPNDIWCVGEIYSDSAKPWLPYNAVHWDGVEWKLERIEFYLCPNGISPTPYPIQSVFAFSKDDIWFTRGASFVHWNGTTYLHDCSMNSLIGGSINEVWGTSSQNLYAAGYSGTILQYNGNRWYRVPDPGDVNIHDVWGGVNPKTGEREILAIGSSWPQSLESVDVLKIHEAEYGWTIPVSTEGLPIAMTCLWFMPGQIYYVGGDGLYYTRKLGTPWKQITGQPLIFRSRIRGQALNDIFVVGGFSLISHFNGMSWHHYSQSELPPMTGNYADCAYQGDLIVAVGRRNPDAIILVGHRK